MGLSICSLLNQLVVLLFKVMDPLGEIALLKEVYYWGQNLKIYSIPQSLAYSPGLLHGHNCIQATSCSCEHFMPSLSLWIHKPKKVILLKLLLFMVFHYKYFTHQSKITNFTLNYFKYANLSISCSSNYLQIIFTKAYLKLI